MLWCCVTPERVGKTTMIMKAMSDGNPKAKMIIGEPPDDGEPFIVWGQEWLTLRIVPDAIKKGRPFWHLDNGFWRPSRGTSDGYYRITYRGFSPVLLPWSDTMLYRLLRVEQQPWRTDGKHIVIGLPGTSFGMAAGISSEEWVATIEERVRAATDRPIIVRPKLSKTPLREDLKNCWALVTHSSNVAVDAVIAGVPVFVAPTNPAAPVGRTDLDLEHPVTPLRDPWLGSLMSQQFTLDEMRTGVAGVWMKRVADFVDQKSPL